MPERSRKTQYPGGSSLLSSIKDKMIIARVTDIILNSEHPNFESYGGWPSIGTISYEEQDQPGSNFNTVAKPFYPQISSYPLINELVLLFFLPNTTIGKNRTSKSAYYINMIGIWNNPHHNAYPNPIEPRISPSSNKDYFQTAAGSYVRKTDSGSLQPDGNSIALNSPSNPSQGTFIERSNIHPLLPFAGDIIHEGRWGNSIRFGSTANPNFITPNNTPVLNNWSDVTSNGNPITIIRNGQDPNNTSFGWVPTTENINEDLSSIYLTSNQKLPFFTQNFSFFSYPEKTKPTTPNTYTGPQVAINSDRLVFNAKKDHVLISGEKSINLSSNNSLNFDSKQVIIETGIIKLGSQFASEPVVKGQTLYNDLDFMLDSLIQIVKVLEDSKLWPGGNSVPNPSGLVALSTKEALKDLKKNLKDILSTTVKTL